MGGRHRENSHQFLNPKGGITINTLDKYDAYAITRNYLIKKYGKELGTQIFLNEYQTIFDYHGLAWKLGKECFPYFCNIYLYNMLFDVSDGKTPLSQKHFEIWDELEDCILNKNNTKNCYIFPRSFGKTTTITQSICIWSALYCLHPFNVIDSANERLSKTILADIKKHIEDNEYIKDSFGEIINKDLTYNAEEIELDVKPMTTKIMCVSSTSGVRGLRYNSHRIGLLILDDAQDEKQITSEATRADLVQRIDNGLLKTLQNNNNHVIALGTVQCKNDLYDTFNHSLKWRTRKEKCILLDDIDEYFRTNQHWQKVKDILKHKDSNPYAEADAEDYYYNHKDEMDFPIIWENYNRFALAVDYYSNPVSFKQEYQSDIDNLGERRIKGGCARIPARDIESKAYIKTILSVDPASTANEKSDFSAFCVLSEEEHTHLKYCRKLIIDKLEFENYLNKVMELLLHYPEINTVSIERQTFSGADVKFLQERISNHPLLRNRDINFINKNRTKNKDNRIDAIIPEINLRRVMFNEDDAEAIEQVESFAGANYTANDDAIDSLADALEYITTINPPLPKLKLYRLSDFGF